MKNTKWLSGSLILFFIAALLFMGFFKRGSFKSLAKFENNFGMRNDLIRFVNNIKFHVLRDHFFYQMYTVDHRWLNYTGENSYDDFQNTTPLSENELASIQGKMDRMLTTLREQGIPVYVVIPPNKSTLYGDDIQAIAPKVLPESRLDQLVDYCNTHGELKIIDLRPALIKASEERLTFHSTDTHWNDYGAFIGYTEILKVISKDFPELQPHPLSDFDQEIVKRQGDLSVMNRLLNVQDDAVQLILKDPLEYDLVEKEENGMSFETYTLQNSDLPRAMVFRDSFFVALFPFMSQHFSRLYSVRTFTVNHEFIMNERPDLLIIEFTERYLHALQNMPY